MASSTQSIHHATQPPLFRCSNRDFLSRLRDGEFDDMNAYSQAYMQAIEGFMRENPELERRLRGGLAPGMGAGSGQ